MKSVFNWQGFYIYSFAKTAKELFPNCNVGVRPNIIDLY